MSSKSDGGTVVDERVSEAKARIIAAFADYKANNASRWRLRLSKDDVLLLVRLETGTVSDEMADAFWRGELDTE